jgi:hypothetical protein
MLVEGNLRAQRVKILKESQILLLKANPKKTVLQLLRVLLQVEIRVLLQSRRKGILLRSRLKCMSFRLFYTNI